MKKKPIKLMMKLRKIATESAKTQILTIKEQPRIHLLIKTPEGTLNIRIMKFLFKRRGKNYLRSIAKLRVFLD